MYLESIALPEYEAFARAHFEKGGRQIEPGVVENIYERFDGITWYVQKMLNMLYSITPEKGTVYGKDDSRSLAEHSRL